MATASSSSFPLRPSSVTILFLDIDGVLLPFGEGGTPGKPFARQFHSSCGCIFPDGPLLALSHILEQIPNSVLVLSSTWRTRFTDDILQDFHRFGQKYKHFSATTTNNNRHNPLRTIQFYDRTDVQYHSERQWEIHRWLQQRQLRQEQRKENQHDHIKAWIALDDEELIEGEHNVKHQQEFQGHVVKTQSHVGLTMNDAKLAIQLYKKQLQATRTSQTK